MPGFNTYTNNGAPPNPEPLTVAQIEQMRARSRRSPSELPGVTEHHELTYSTCSDGGTDAGHD